MFFKGSRYEKVPERIFRDEGGREVRYKLRRFIPENRPILRGHRVHAHERLDHIAWQHYRDAEQFWRIGDANRALWPDDLLEEAAIIRIPAVEH